MFKSLRSSSGSCGSGKVIGRLNTEAPTIRPSYFNDVVKKLRNVDQGISEEDLPGKVEELTEEGTLWSVYFSGIVLDPARDHIEKNLDGPGSTDAPRGPGVPIKLRLTPVRGGGQYGVLSFTSMLLEHYGPIHASMVVGGAVVLEWGVFGLIIPTGVPIPPPEEVLRHPEAAEVAAANPERLEEMIVQEFETTLARKEHVDQLIKVVVRYNKNYLYHPIFRNCQKFVHDCLSALAYPIPPKLEGRLGDYIQAVKKGRRRNIDFGSHQDLDAYVGRVLESGGTTPLEAEYLLAQYFLFHVTSMTESARPERWTCAMRGCLMSRLENSVGELKDTIAYRMFVAAQ